MNADGFVDLQVNGTGGVNFSSPVLTKSGVVRAAAKLASQGTAAFLATVTTSSLEDYQAALPILAQAINENSTGGRCLGIHLEGPFLSPEPGAVGTHPQAHICAPDPEILDRLLALAGGTVRLITIAPERRGAIELIRHAKARGLVVAIGHTLAGTESVAAAVAAGASLSTHLGNGCPNSINRHTNPIWAQLASDLTAMLITDGQHLPADVIKVFLRTKLPDQVLVTSDSSHLAGCAPDTYSAYGTTVRLLPSGRIINESADTLAGSSACMLDCLNHLAALGYDDEALLWRLGREKPLAALGLKAEAIPPLPKPIAWREGRFVYPA